VCDKLIASISSFQRLGFNYTRTSVFLAWFSQRVSQVLSKAEVLDYLSEVE
jgi:hypothetical protein